MLGNIRRGTAGLLFLFVSFGPALYGQGGAVRAWAQTPAYYLVRPMAPVFDSPDLPNHLVGQREEGDSVMVHCQVVGPPMNDSRIWNYLGSLPAGGWVSAYFLPDQPRNEFDPRLPVCDASVTGDRPADTRAQPAPPPPPAEVAVGQGSAPDSRLVSGAYQITLSGVNVRSGPGTQFALVRVASRGERVQIVCQQVGTNVRGSSIWDQIGAGEWVSDYFVQTPVFAGFSPGLTRCDQPPTPAAPVASIDSRSATAPWLTQLQVNWGAPPSQLFQWVSAASAVSPAPALPAVGALVPPSREAKAVAWALAQVGQKYQPDGRLWSGWCDRFVANAYGVANSGYTTATIHFRDLQARGLVHTDLPPAGGPPAGALVFLTGFGGYGHVAISLGDGRYVTTWGDGSRYIGPVRIETSLPASVYGNYLGWSYANPEWPGR